MKISIVIPTYTHDVMPCLRSVFQYTSGAEIIVVANGSPPPKVAALRNLPGIRLIESPEPLGYAGAVNVGVKNSTGDYIVLLNDDCLLLEQPVNRWLDQLLAPFSSPTVGLTGPLYGYSAPADANFLVFFCVMIRRAVFDAIGYLDESFNPGAGEDTDFCIRAEQAGFKVVTATVGPTRPEGGLVIGDFPIYHKGEATVAHLPGWEETFKKNAQKLLEKYNKKWRLSNYCERAVIGAADDAPPRERARYEWAAKRIVGRKVLEIGCSSGYALRFLKDVDYHGIDKDPAVIEYARRQFGDHFEVADINAYDYGQYDTIIAFEVLEHLDNGRELAQKLKNHCRCLLATCPYDETPLWVSWHKLSHLVPDSFPGFKARYISAGGEIATHPMGPETILLMSWGEPEVLCFVPTRGRYETTLPLTLAAVINQTRPPDRVVIYDDGDHRDLREIPIYRSLFMLAERKGISWEVVFGDGSGQHRGHQISQGMGAAFVWRVDDDEIPEPDVLEILLRDMGDGVGAVGGPCLVPGMPDGPPSVGKITEPGLPSPQWRVGQRMDVEHLHSTFLYRPGIVDYDSRLSPAAHREETIFTHEIFRRGKRLIYEPRAVTWHLRNPEGGIRSHSDRRNWDHDEGVFRLKMAEWGRGTDGKLVYLDSGLGDHIVFSTLVPELLARHKKLVVACCYPEVFGGMAVECVSLECGKMMGADPETHNVYKWMADRAWNRPLVDAYRGLYL